MCKNFQNRSKSSSFPNPQGCPTEQDEGSVSSRAGQGRGLAGPSTRYRQNAHAETARSAGPPGPPAAGSRPQRQRRFSSFRGLDSSAGRVPATRRAVRVEAGVARGPCSRPGVRSRQGQRGLGRRGQSGVPGRREVDDDGRVHGLVVDGTHRRVHVGGGPVRHDAIPWKASTHLSGLRAGGRWPAAGGRVGWLCRGQATKTQLRLLSLNRFMTGAPAQPAVRIK